MAFGALALAVSAYFRNEIAAHFAPGGWQPGNLYNAVFNWASIQSGFVFGIYGFIATKQGGFIGELANGRILDELMGYARRAYLTGFGLTFLSLPLMVVSPKIDNVSDASFWVVSAWFAAFIWTFCAFLRVAFIFGMIVAVPDRKPEFVG